MRTNSIERGVFPARKIIKRPLALAGAAVGGRLAGPRLGGAPWRAVIPRGRIPRAINAQAAAAMGP